jgi:hypothetical protein
VEGERGLPHYFLFIYLQYKNNGLFLFLDGLTDADVFQALLYAACKGGNLLVVKRWLLPNEDINRPLALLTCFDHCEQKIPMHVACEGNIFKFVHFITMLPVLLFVSFIVKHTCT